MNALVIVGVLAAATFGLLLCYWAKRLRFMNAYLGFTMVVLLGESRRSVDVRRCGTIYP